MAVYVSLCVDDLDYRSNPNKADRVSTYDCTPEEIQQILRLIRQINDRDKARKQAAEQDRKSKMTAAEIKAEQEAIAKSKADDERRNAYNMRYGDAAN